MHIVQVVTTHGTSFQLMFDSPDRALTAFMCLRGDPEGSDIDQVNLEVEDDYGQRINVDRDELPVVLLQDLARVHQAQVAIQVMHAEAAARLQKLVPQQAPVMAAGQRIIRGVPSGPYNG